MTKKTLKATSTLSNFSNFAGEIADMYKDITEDKVLARAEVVLLDFARKDDERLQQVALINNAIAIAQEKLDKAEKTTNKAALAKTIAYLEADKVEIITLRAAAKSKRDEFISNFEIDAYATLADSKLVREGLAKDIAKAA